MAQAVCLQAAPTGRQGNVRVAKSDLTGVFTE